MDITNRNVQPQASASNGQFSPAGNSSGGKRNKANNNGFWNRVGIAAAVAAVVILLCGVIVLAMTAGDSKKESDYVYTNKLQAVFYNNGQQVYFGNIKAINSKYLVLGNIYYLQTTSDGTAKGNAKPNITLVKRGCELHEPYDQMVFNRDQVSFWENLQDDGQVATAIANFKKQYPEGKKCAEQGTNTNTNNVQKNNDSQSTDTNSNTTDTSTSTNP